jgi:hypothetical protein
MSTTSVSLNSSASSSGVGLDDPGESTPPRRPPWTHPIDGEKNVARGVTPRPEPAHVRRVYSWPTWLLINSAW